MRFLITASSIGLVRAGGAKSTSAKIRGAAIRSPSRSCSTGSLEMETPDEDRVRGFEQEARAASALNHPNMITVYEIGEVDDTLHAPATDGEGRVLLRAVLDVATQIAIALAAAHAAGSVHHDFKPEDVMVHPTGR